MIDGLFFVQILTWIAMVAVFLWVFRLTRLDTVLDVRAAEPLPA